MSTWSGALDGLRSAVLSFVNRRLYRFLTEGHFLNRSQVLPWARQTAHYYYYYYYFFLRFFRGPGRQLICGTHSITFFSFLVTDGAYAHM